MMHLCILILYSLHLVDGFQNNIVQQPHHSYCRRDNSCGAGSNGLVDFNSDVNLEGVASAEGEIAPHIAIPGGGIYFYWQAGVITFLREQGYDLSQCTFTGASAGALTATFGSTNVDFYKATELALSLAADAGVWDRKGGLQGIWGPMIEEWLETLIPSDCIENLNGRLSLLGSPHIDGSFLARPGDFLPSKRSGDDDSVLILDWQEDPVMSSKGGLDFVEALSPDGIYGLLEYGKTHAKRMEEQGRFASLKKI
ncbi:MAG: hypothetical protein SGBAC_002709 [Bacillariaceae sp.]